jgi:fermentation-respiration switch protein FrsA (DUF1100 family)
MEIEGLITYPLGFVRGEKYPFVTMLHGGPKGVSSQNFPARPGPASQALWAGNGYAVSEPNFRGSSGYGEQFRSAIVGDFGGAEFRDIMTGIDQVIEMDVADPEQLVIFCGSYGGYLAAWAPTQTDRFKAAITYGGVSNLFSFAGTTHLARFTEEYLNDRTLSTKLPRERSPVHQIRRVKGTSYLILHGETDRTSPVTQAYELYGALKRNGLFSELIVYPNAGHTTYSYSPQQLADVMLTALAWANRFIRPSKRIYIDPPGEDIESFLDREGEQRPLANFKWGDLPSGYLPVVFSDFHPTHRVAEVCPSEATLDANRKIQLPMLKKKLYLVPVDSLLHSLPSTDRNTLRRLQKTDVNRSAPVSSREPLASKAHCSPSSSTCVGNDRNRQHRRI